MLIGKNIRRVSHNLIISKYFEEENNEIQNQYFIRNVADELSVISLGFGGFFVAINPCSFAIEYSTDTFEDMTDINLVEVAQFEAKAATVFRLDGQTEMPSFDYDYIRTQLQSDAEKDELDEAIASITGVNSQYSIEQGSLGTNFDSIELNVEALNAANYKHLESEEYKIVGIEEEAHDLELEIARRKQELEQLNQELANKEEILTDTQTHIDMFASKPNTDTDAEVEGQAEVDNDDFANFSTMLDELNDFLTPDDLFAELDSFVDEADERNQEQAAIEHAENGDKVQISEYAKVMVEEDEPTEETEEQNV